MIKNVIIVILVLSCAYLALRLYGPAPVREWLGGGEGEAAKGREAVKTKGREGEEAREGGGERAMGREGEKAKGREGERRGAQSAPWGAEGSPSEGAQFGSRVLRRGMNGPDVARLQERLKLAGFVRSNFMPGCFDEATERAVLAYQEGTEFLKEMYGFRGLPPPHKPYVDRALAEQLLRVPTPDKALIHYTVAPKENLFRIATKFHVGPDSIKYLNGLGDSGGLKIGQSLLIICDQSRAQ